MASSHISPRDKRIQYEAEEKAKISGFPTSKQLREAKETVDARLRTDEEEVWKIGLVRFFAFLKSISYSQISPRKEKQSHSYHQPRRCG